MEDGVYVCSWKQDAGGFELWLKSRPHIRGKALNYQEAEELLIAAIQNAGGAMCAVLEFDPSLPKSELEVKYANPELCLIVGDDRFETDAPKALHFETSEERDDRLKWDDCYFQKPVCRKCCFATSPRSEKPLRVRSLSSKYDGAFGYVGRNGANFIRIVSEDFVRLLTPEEQRRLVLRPVERKGRGRSYYEVIGPKGPPLVAVAGLELSGWRCTACNFRIWGYRTAMVSICSFVAKSDLPLALPGIFTVGALPDIHLCATAKRWQEMLGRKGTRGFTSSLLGVAPDHEVVRLPDLPGR